MLKHYGRRQAVGWPRGPHGARVAPTRRSPDRPAANRPGQARRSNGPRRAAGRRGRHPASRRQRVLGEQAAGDPRGHRSKTITGKLARMAEIVDATRFPLENASMNASSGRPASWPARRVRVAVELERVAGARPGIRRDEDPAVDRIGQVHPREDLGAGGRLPLGGQVVDLRHVGGVGG